MRSDGGLEVGVLNRRVVEEVGIGVVGERMGVGVWEGRIMVDDELFVVGLGEV